MFKQRESQSPRDGSKLGVRQGGRAKKMSICTVECDSGNGEQLLTRTATWRDLEGTKPDTRAQKLSDPTSVRSLQEPRPQRQKVDGGSHGWAGVGSQGFLRTEYQFGEMEGSRHGWW